MELNKELSIKEILGNAMKKIKEDDLSGAKNLLSEAQNIYPNLEGVPQILKVLEVYIALNKKVGGEIDWYGVIKAEPSDTDESIRKQCNEMALAFHPATNKYMGADDALKVISEAQKLFLDKNKKLNYDLKRYSYNTYGISGDVPTTPNVRKYVNFFENTSIRTEATHLHEKAPPVHDSCHNQNIFTWFTPSDKIPDKSCMKSENAQPHQQVSSSKVSYDHQNISRWVTSNTNISNKTFTKSETAHFSQRAPPLHDSYKTTSVAKVPNKARTKSKIVHPRQRAFLTQDAYAQNYFKGTERSSSVSSLQLNIDPFWTACPECGIYFEYERIFLNFTLTCINCGNPFLATEEASGVMKKRKTE